MTTRATGAPKRQAGGVAFASQFESVQAALSERECTSRVGLRPCTPAATASKMTTRATGAPKRQAGGVAFASQFESVQANRAARGPGAFTERRDVLNEEEKLIRKIFEMIDQDNSGEINPDELKLLFNISGLNNQPGFDALGSAVERIMSQAQMQGLGTYDDAGNSSISENAFITLLSAKFSSKDSENDMLDVFDRMAEGSGREYLTAEDLQNTALKLGETNVSMETCKEMLALFNRKYQEDLAKFNSKDKSQPNAPRPPDRLSKEDYLEIMKKDLETEEEINDFYAQ
eukprot:CAMPEP_0178407720 /NCGR_PEP_ID=MMETSP0689_2-20121128/19572_1 /TAXON_ID=160604 /ORGANISM="Amphidinium massartii, Strain CS-259" /LENGTH=287 /DNA_ID=CAMNT_0020028799 /DNA_START=100 /DNA_END=963 /DNA_ORIENTATION=+